MPSLQVIRRRIRSVQNTQKITRAMQMVAGAKLRRSQGELVGFKPYAQRLEEIARRFLAAHSDLEHPLVSGSGRRPVPDTVLKPIGLVVVTSDTGLCGTYNERVISLSTAFLKENPSAQVVVIGKKGNRSLARRGIRRVREILDWGGRYEPKRGQELLDWIEERYVKGEISAWWIATTQFISALRFTPSVDRFLPLEGTDSQAFPEKVIHEPNQESVAQELLGRFLRAKFARILLEAFTAEHSARMIAMKNATDNAEEMVEHLTLIRNKVRQAAITKELIEVVSGAEALK